MVTWYLAGLMFIIIQMPLGLQGSQMPAKEDAEISHTREQAVIQAMIHAVKEGAYETLSNLLSNHDPFLAYHSDFSGNSLGNFLLILAAQYLENNCAEEISQLLLNHGADVNPTGSHSTTPLIEAVSEENVPLVRLLLRYGAHNDSPFCQGVPTPLFLAVKAQNHSMVKLLVEAQADANWCNSSRNSIMHQAALGSPDIVTFLLQAGGKLDICNNDGEHPLLYACRNNADKSLTALLEHEKMVNIININGMSALHYASQLNNLYAAKLLLQANANPNSINEHGNTLHFAITSKAADMVALLLANKADPHTPDSHGLTALYKAVSYNLLNIVIMLLEAGANPNTFVNGSTAIHLAATKGHLECLQALLKFNGNTHQKNVLGKTPLHEAVRWPKICTLLIDNKADCNACDYQESTPLFEAVNEHVIESATVLIAAGADANQAVKTVTPLHLAAYRGYTDLITLLLSHGANPNSQNNLGKTPLIDAICPSTVYSEGMLAAVEALLSHKADPNIIDNQKNSPLFKAIEKNEIAIIKLLLQAQANPNHTIQGTSLLHYAVLKEFIDAAQLLVARGARVDAQNSIGNTPLHLAVCVGNKALMKLLLDHNAHVTIAANNNMTALQQERLQHGTFIHQYYPCKQMIQLALPRNVRLGGAPPARNLTVFDMKNIYDHLKNSYQ